jgi:hypothetical protein
LLAEHDIDSSEALLSSPFPRKVLHPEDGASLEQQGLGSRQVLNVEPSLLAQK